MKLGMSTPYVLQFILIGQKIMKGLDVLPSNTSIFTAEVTAIDLALEIIAESDDGHFIIFSDSLLVLLSLHNRKRDNPLI